jgi:phosphopantothenate---cysteine ligase (CTP)
VKSSHPELWLKLVPTPKLIDKVRSDWSFAGVLVKFKLEVGLTEKELRDVAERARLHSRADLMVANMLEGMNDWALVGGEAGYARVPRGELAERLIEAVEERVSGRG